MNFSASTVKSRYMTDSAVLTLGRWGTDPDSRPRGPVLECLSHNFPLLCLRLVGLKVLSGWGTLSLGQALSVPFSPLISALRDFPGGARGKEPAHQRRRDKKLRFDPWVRKIPWGREWQPTSVFLPGESHGQRSLAGHRVAELDTTDSWTL